MTIILRLQGLDVRAGTEDIRKFFEYIHIPEGGVYIVGGSLREAFIAFTTERDAQLAMRQTGNFLKGSEVTLHISSMEEMEHKLKSLLKGRKPSSTKLIVKRPKLSPKANLPPTSATLPSSTATPPPSTAWSLGASIENFQTSNAHSLDPNAAFLLGVCTVLKSLQSSHQGENNEVVPRIDFPQADGTVVVSNELRKPEQNEMSRPGYVRLFGLPASVTKEDICCFFRGLTVQEAIVNVMLGLNHGCLVKFANMQDANDALRFNQQSLGDICVEVRRATEKMWTSALIECENASDVEESVKPKQSPLVENANKHRLISTLQIKKGSVNRLPMPFKSPKKPRIDRDSSTSWSTTMEYIVMVSKVPKKMTKTELKELFGCPNITHKNVLHLLDKVGNRTDTAFLIFNKVEDYDYAMNLNGCHVGPDAIEVSSITRQKMRYMMAKTHPRSLNHNPKIDAKTKLIGKRKSNPAEKPEGRPSTNLDPAAQTCLFVRNLPKNVHESHIKSLFHKYKLRNDNIILLHDRYGKGNGEAVVQFKSQKLAAMAHKLHSQDFMGAKVLLTLINVTQMEDILARDV